MEEKVIQTNFSKLFSRFSNDTHNALSLKLGEPVKMYVHLMVFRIFCLPKIQSKKVFFYNS